MAAVTTEQTRIAPLVGKELTRKVEELNKLSRTEKAKSCGYYSVNKKGFERINMKQFLNALIDAGDIELNEDEVKKNSEATSTRFPVSVQVAREANSVQVVKVNRNSKTVEKPKRAPQVFEQEVQVESVSPVEVDRTEQPGLVPQWKSLAEPVREESVCGSGWSLAQLMNEFDGRVSG